MAIKLSAELRRYVNRKVRSGQFPTVDAVFAKAVVVMWNVERYAKSAEDELRREIQIGIDQLDRGEGKPWNVEEAKARLLRRVARRRRIDRPR